MSVAVMPQAPGRAPQGLAALRPGAETLLTRGTTPGPPPTPPILLTRVPSARPSEVLASAPPARPSEVLASAPSARPSEVLASAPPARRPARGADERRVTT